MVATVVQVKGSVPREVGAKMVIYPDGQTYDTIGGGAGEAKVIATALTVFKTGLKQWVEIDLSGHQDRETQGVCGGWMLIWLECWSDRWAYSLVEAVLTVLQSHHSAALVTSLSQEAIPRLQLEFPEQLTGSSPPVLKLLNLFVERLDPDPVLVIVGGGHVGSAVASCADWLDFQVILQDDRPEELQSVEVSPTVQLTHGSVDTILAALPPSVDLYVALVTRSYHHDLSALRILFKTSPRLAYVGMMGSQRRIQTVFQHLRQEEMPEEWLQRIRAPIGLKIGAQTPNEIALSICAELIAVQNEM